MHAEILALLCVLYCIGWCAVRGMKKGREAEGEEEKGKAGDGRFRAFQVNYLTVFSLVMYSDWLKGPYVYALYDSYGFSKKDIADLFVMGFLSSLICGTYCGAISDMVGRRCMCLVFCLTYAASALTKLVPDYWVLMLGRVLAGIATSLLMTTFEAWMVSEHGSRGYAPHLLTNTFAWATQANGVVAVAAGVSASAVATQYGYAAPFVLAVPPLVAVAAVITLTWRENYGDRMVQPFAPAMAALRHEPSLVYLGMSQALFEAGMFTWVFLWTPAVVAAAAPDTVPFGVVFAAFMAAFMLGSLYFEASFEGLSEVSRHLPYLLHALAACSAAITAFSKTQVPVLGAFLLYEFACGIFFPVYGTLRASHVPEASRAAISNLFRFPTNLLVVVFLLTSAQQDIVTGFAVLVVTHVVGLLAFWRFDVLRASGTFNSALRDATESAASHSPSAAKRVDL